MKTVLSQRSKNCWSYHGGYTEYFIFCFKELLTMSTLTEKVMKAGGHTQSRLGKKLCISILFVSSNINFKIKFRQLLI